MQEEENADGEKVEGRRRHSWLTGMIASLSHSITPHTLKVEAWVGLLFVGHGCLPNVLAATRRQQNYGHNSKFVSTPKWFF